MYLLSSIFLFNYFYLEILRLFLVIFSSALSKLSKPGVQFELQLQIGTLVWGDNPLRMRAGLLHANGITLLNSLHNSCAAHLI